MARMKFGREPATNAESPITASVNVWAPWAVGGRVFAPPTAPPDVPELVPDPPPAELAPTRPKLRRNRKAR